MAYDPATLSRAHPLRDKPALSPALQEAISWQDPDGRWHGPDHVALRAVPIRKEHPGRPNRPAEKPDPRDDATRMRIRAEVEDYAIRLLDRSLPKTVLALFLAFAAAPATAQAQGAAYLGAFAGIGATDTTETVGGIKMVDIGGDFALFGIRGGYGYRYESGLYLGAEAEAFTASGRSRVMVPAANSSTGATETWNRAMRAGAGIFGRVGIAPGPATTEAPPSLFYARLGAQAFDTSQGTQFAPAVGVGAEVRLTRRLSARLDVTYAWGDVETYQATVGLSWRF